eukprot:CAMPEP_0196994264 /NCGR_PEP_ID=MMETSP1380-20130617/581_1 /TAXON_ID=5936 /ORGANISM="Euplotes crassus, Strain CT5" /LENGTH=55 /DNA_ID=CAMNT_0042409593 /DNA_START=1242 /DNA_END=1409 /DNA_ORIENTATION=+
MNLEKYVLFPKKHKPQAETIPIEAQNTKVEGNGQFYKFVDNDDTMESGKRLLEKS